jgi:hypothetical protein
MSRMQRRFAWGLLAFVVGLGIALASDTWGGPLAPHPVLSGLLAVALISAALALADRYSDRLERRQAL